jgi:hypothetical protein
LADALDVHHCRPSLDRFAFQVFGRHSGDAIPTGLTECVLCLTTIAHAVHAGATEPFQVQLLGRHVAEIVQHPLFNDAVALALKKLKVTLQGARIHPRNLEK